MPYRYKTVYVPAPELKNKSAFSTGIPEVNGDEISRLTQATLVEMEGKGFELQSVTPIIHSKTHMGSYAYSYVDGLMLIFKRVE